MREYAAACTISNTSYILTVAVNGTVNIFSFSGSGWPRASVAYVVA